MIYCRKFLTLSNQTSCYIHECIRIHIDLTSTVAMVTVNGCQNNGYSKCLLDNSCSVTVNNERPNEMMIIK